MQAIEALTQRVSHGKLKAPGPTAEQREHMETAALRAADHGCLRPWRYLYIDGSGLEALGQLFLYAAKQAQPELSETQAQRFAAMPLRAPAIYIAIATITAHPKVSREEQLMAVAASVQNMITAAFALGVGAIWRSGDMAVNPVLKQGLGLTANEEIIGFIYTGTPENPDRQPPRLQVTDFFSNWPPKPVASG